MKTLARTLASSLLILAACTSEGTDDGFGFGDNGPSGDGDGDGDGDTGSGAGDGDGDGDGSGDGDGDGSGDGDGDGDGAGDGDGDGDGAGDGDGDGDGAPVCGDGNVDLGEDCDGNNLDGQTCITQGFDQGTLACTGNCTFDTTGCSNASCESQPLSGEYMHCLAPEDCQGGATTCAQVGQDDNNNQQLDPEEVDDGFCTNNCVNAASCGTVAGCSAVAACFNTYCYLDCEGGLECPAGMVCTQINAGNNVIREFCY